MKKFADKLRGKKDPKKPDPRVDDEVDPKYPVVGPVPAPQPYDDNRNRTVQAAQPDPQEDIGTFPGFHDWIGKFKPDPVASNVVEVDAEAVRPRVGELLTLPGGEFLFSSYR